MAVHDFKFEVVRLREKQDGGSAASACLDSGSEEDGRYKNYLVTIVARRVRQHAVIMFGRWGGGSSRYDVHTPTHCVVKKKCSVCFVGLFVVCFVSHLCVSACASYLENRGLMHLRVSEIPAAL